MKLSRTRSAAAPAATAEAVPAALLDTIVARSAPPSHAQGIAVGRLDALADDGTPLVGIEPWGLSRLAARSLVPVDADRIGQSVALGFEAEDPRKPIILGFVIAPAAATAFDARLDGERMILKAEREIELRCGEAAIVLSADGRITLRGTYITSQASATQRILGGSINLN